MANRRKWPPTIQNHKGTARARGRDGIYRYFGKYGSPESEKSFSAWLAKESAPTPSTYDQTEPTVDDVCGIWWDFHQDKLQDQERRNYDITIRALIRSFGNIFAKDFDSTHLEDFQEILASGSWLNEEERKEYEKRKRPTDLSRKVVNRRVVRVKTIWRWLERKKKIPKGSCENVCLVRALPKRPDLRETEGVQPSSLENVLKVAQHCPDAVAAMLELQWWCGMRSGEVRIMRTCDIDQSGDVWLYAPSKHKNLWRGQKRIVPIPPEAQKILAPWLKPDDPEAYLFPPTGPRSSSKNPCYTAQAYAYRVNCGCKKAGVKLVPYSGRHAAKDRITKEHGLDAARAFLGQKSIQTTDGYGSALDMELALKAARKESA